MSYTVSIVLIGHELLDGRVQDRNLSYLSKQLLSYGKGVKRATFVNDTLEDIIEALRQEDAYFVIVSGGLGPTRDDLTREAAATFLGVPLEEDPEIVSQLEARFREMGKVFTPNNVRQACKPEGATWVPNYSGGTAPGFIFEHLGQTYLFLPGVPREFQAMLDAVLKERFSGEARAVRSLYFTEISESGLAHLIEPFPSTLQVGYRAMSHMIEVKLTAGGIGEAYLQVLEENVERIQSVTRPYILSVDRFIEEEIGVLLLERGQNIAVAESCTSGLLASKITDVAGSSAYFQYGYVTYSNEAKNKMLGVPVALLERYGAVSREVVAAMVLGLHERTSCDWGLAISGIAGPGGGNEKKPVGLVYFGLYGPEGVYTMERHFGDLGRKRVRERSVIASLHLLRQAMLGAPLPSGVESAH